MKKQLENLAQRRRALSETIEAQRTEVTRIAAQWQKPLVLVDAGLKVVRFLRSHSGLVSGCLAAFLSLRGIGTGGLAKKGWRMLYLYPAAVSFGLKYLFSAIRSSSDEKLLEDYPGESQDWD